MFYADAAGSGIRPPSVASERQSGSERYGDADSAVADEARRAPTAAISSSVLR